VPSPRLLALTAGRTTGLALAATLTLAGAGATHLLVQPDRAPHSERLVGAANGGSQLLRLAPAGPGGTPGPDGSTLRPDGTVLRPDGSVLRTDGTVLNTDGTVLRTDGSVLKTDGSVLNTDGTVLRTDGTVVQSNGTVVAPDGTVVGHGPAPSPTGSAPTPSTTPTSAIPTSTAPTGPAIPAGTLVVTPAGGGTRDGSSWANAGTLADLPKLVKRGPSTVWIRADLGSYPTSGPVILTARSGAALTIKGVGPDGRAAKPLITGTRTTPYAPSGAAGAEVFRLMAGASNLRFESLAFANVGNGAFRIGGDVSGLTLQDITATNVYRFLEDNVSGSATSASITGLTVRDVQVTGFSRSVVRLAYASSDVLLEDVTGDSQRQSGDDFAIGVHLDGSTHDVTLRRVSMANAHNTRTAYWNGDGFATERGVSDVRFEDTSATGNTDAGYDIKSGSTTLVRAKAADNKRNFRFWATDTSVTSCTGAQPRTRGGTGSQDQVWLEGGAQVTMTGCTFTDSSPSSIGFSVGAGAGLTVTGGSVSIAAASTLQWVDTGGRFDLTAPVTTT
jgi:hypothetical protein